MYDILFINLKKVSGSNTGFIFFGFSPARRVNRFIFCDFKTIERNKFKT